MTSSDRCAQNISKDQIDGMRVGRNEIGEGWEGRDEMQLEKLRKLPHSMIADKMNATQESFPRST